MTTSRRGLPHPSYATHPATIKLVQEGKIDLKPFITARIGLDDLVEDGFGTLIHHKDTAVKILVHP